MAETGGKNGDDFPCTADQEEQGDDVEEDLRRMEERRWTKVGR